MWFVHKRWGWVAPRRLTKACCSSIAWGCLHLHRSGISKSVCITSAFALALQPANRLTVHGILSIIEYAAGDRRFQRKPRGMNTKDNSPFVAGSLGRRNFASWPTLAQIGSQEGPSEGMCSQKRAWFRAPCFHVAYRSFNWPRTSSQIRQLSRNSRKLVEAIYSIRLSCFVAAALFGAGEETFLTFFFKTCDSTDTFLVLSLFKSSTRMVRPVCGRKGKLAITSMSRSEYSFRPKQCGRFSGSNKRRGSLMIFGGLNISAP